VTAGGIQPNTLSTLSHGTLSPLGDGPRLEDRRGGAQHLGQQLQDGRQVGALGLDCGPMSGFDNAKLDEEFFGAGKECEGCEQEFFPAGHVKSNFLCNLGYGDESKLFPRGPRLAFNEACTLL
jgi:hypothetical protein